MSSEAAISDCSDSFEIVRRRLRDGILARVSPSSAIESWVALQAADGTWPDIDYTDTDGMRFRPMGHVARGLELAVAEHPEAALAALSAWRRIGPRSENWWYNEIGVPQAIGDTLLVVFDRLGEPQRRAWRRWLAECAGPVTMTGQNLIWSQGIGLRAALLVNDGAAIAAASDKMASVLRVTEGEGIQSDLTFHQHGAQLYTGGYGAGLVNDASAWIHALHGTEWALPAPAVSLLVDFLLDGVQWALHGEAFDFTTIGREIARPSAHRPNPDLRRSVRLLCAAGAPRQADLAAFEARLATAGTEDAADDLIGCRYFPHSDYLVHRRPGWSISVRMSSSRTVMTESMNGENLRGRHLGDGVAAVRVGHAVHDGYREVMATWDWARLPGITAQHTSEPALLHPRPNTQHGSSEHVAGWSDGRVGIAVMSLAGTDTFTEGWKAWFCFDDLAVALGAGISAPGARGPVLTTIDQRLAHDAITIDRHAPARYVHHGAIGYVQLAEHPPLSADIRPRTGTWRQINESGSDSPATTEIFTVGFDHGPSPRNANYACLILPAADTEATMRRAASPGVSVLSNTARLQAVSHLASGLTLYARHDENGLALGCGPTGPIN